MPTELGHGLLQPHRPETVTVRSAAPDRLEAEVTRAPGGKLPPVHLHPSQDEHLEILDGPDVFRLTVPMAIQRPLLALAARVPAGR